MERRKPIWTGAAFLVYAGGLIVLGAALAAIGYLADSSGKAAVAGWSVLVLVVLYAIAHGFRINETLDRRRRLRLRVGYRLSGLRRRGVGLVRLARRLFRGRLAAAGLLGRATLACAADPRRRRRRLAAVPLPLITSVGVVVGWFFVTDLLSGGGSWSAVVTLRLGFVYLAIGSGSDGPSAFWFHLGAGVLIGGSLLYWWGGTTATGSGHSLPSSPSCV